MRCRLVDENGQIGQRVIADLWTDALKPKQVGGGRTIYFTNYTCRHGTHMRPVGCGEEGWVVEADLKPDLARIVPSMC